MPKPGRGGCVAGRAADHGGRRKGEPVRHRLLLPAAALLVGATLAGCGDDQPAVCTSIDELQSSIKGLADLELTGTTNVAGLEDQIDLVKQDYQQLKDDAKAEYDDQIGGIDSDLQTLATNAKAV